MEIVYQSNRRRGKNMAISCQIEGVSLNHWFLCLDMYRNFFPLIPVVVVVVVVDVELVTVVVLVVVVLVIL